MTLVSWVLKEFPVSNFFSPLLHHSLKQKFTPSTNNNQSRNESVVQVHPSATDQATLGCSPGTQQQVNRIRKNPPGQFCLLEVFILCQESKPSRFTKLCTIMLNCCTLYFHFKHVFFLRVKTTINFWQHNFPLIWRIYSNLLWNSTKLIIIKMWCNSKTL